MNANVVMTDFTAHHRRSFVCWASIGRRFEKENPQRSEQNVNAF
jgi:hypothetical protein